LNLYNQENKKLLLLLTIMFFDLYNCMRVDYRLNIDNLF
jgi:hypothetical protein